MKIASYRKHQVHAIRTQCDTTVLIKRNISSINTTQPISQPTRINHSIIIMKLLTAAKFIILAHTSCCVPSVLCTKGGMGDNNATATTEDGNTDERKLASSSSTDYKYLRNYLTIIEPENFVTVFPNGAPNIGTGVTSLVGSSTIQKGGVYDPADIEIVNKLNGVGPDDLTDEVIESFGGNEGDALEAIGGFKFGGGRQPKQPVPPGDSAFFYHGECVATSAINSPSPFPQNKRQLASGGLDALNAFLASFTITSHTCNLNICLGGGGFNCIAFYSGTSFVFDVGEQISRSNPKPPTRSPTPVPTPFPTPTPTFPSRRELGPGRDLTPTPPPTDAPRRRKLGPGRDLTIISEPFNGEIKLPPPFPSTIIGGTGSFEGIEGTVDIATICGTTGPILSVDTSTGEGRRLEPGMMFNQNRLGLIVQTISIKSNMPLPVAP